MNRALSPNIGNGISISSLDVPLECPPSPQASTSKDKGTMTSHVLHYNSPENCRLRKRIKFLEAKYKSKVRRMRQHIRQKNSQVLSLKSILNNLKSKQLLHQNQAQMLEMLGGSGGEIFKRLIQQKQSMLV